MKIYLPHHTSVKHMYHMSFHMVSVSSCENGKETCLTQLACPVSVLHMESQVMESDAHVSPYLFQHTLDRHLVLYSAVKILVSVPNVYKMGAHIFCAHCCVPLTVSLPSFPDLDVS